MNKAELVEAIASQCDLSKAGAERAVNAIVTTITKSLKKGESVTLVGFGTFTVAKRAARSGRNPRTGAALKIKAAKVARFKAGAALKKAVA